MSSEEPILRAENISKCYEMYNKPSHRLWQTLTRGKKKFYKEFWALNGISFSIKRGECVGIIGRNGSGKSTLLQIIAGTLSPTTGDIEFNGKVAALLELGSGFNPEFTGRENIYMNGSVLGLSKKEINEKFNDITEFADIGDFIDQPVKTYSSGMTVRLAFAVQAQLDPDILIVDEALAVGDAAFQMKCISRMRNLMDSGVTVLFVSHSVQAVRSFCNWTIWLDRGEIRMKGKTSEVTSRYMEYLFSGKNETSQTISNNANLTEEKIMRLLDIDYPGREDPLRRWGSGEVRIRRFLMSGSRSGTSPCFERLEEITIVLEAEAVDCAGREAFSFAFACRDKFGVDIMAVSSFEQSISVSDLKTGQKLEARFRFKNTINPGTYMLVLAAEYFQDGKRHYTDFIENVMLFQIVSDRKHFGLFEPELSIELINN